MNVRMPDGTVIENVPDGWTQEMVLQAYREHYAAKQGQPLQRPSEEQLRGAEQVVQSMPVSDRNIVAMGRSVQRPIDAAMGIGRAVGMVPETAYQDYRRGQDENLAYYSVLKDRTPGAGFSEFLGELGMGAPAFRLPTLRNPIADIGLQAGAGGAIGAATGGPEGAGLGFLAGGLGQSVYRTALGLANVPKRILGASMDKSARSQFAQEGRALSQETGIPLTPYQETGNKALGYLEAAARQSFGTADKVSAFDKTQGERAIARIKTVADSIAKHTRGKATIGSDIQSAMNSAVKDIADIRDRTAAVNYGEVRKLANNQPVIRYDNLRAELNSIIQQYDGVPADEAKAIVAGARSKLKELEGVVEPSKDVRTPLITYRKPEVRGNVPGTVDDAMRARKFYGQASRAGGSVFDNVSVPTNKQIAARLFAAVSRDFDQAGNAPGAIGAAFKKANAEYKAYSDSIEYVEKSVLGKVLGEDVADAAFTGVQANTVAGERVFDRLIRAHPSEIKTVMPVLRQANPAVAEEAKAFLIRDALERGVSLSMGDRAVLGPISYSRFAKALPDEARLEALGFSAKELRDVKITLMAMERAGSRFGMNWSNTNVREETMEAASAIGNAASGNLAGAAKLGITILGRYLGLSKVAEAMADPRKRQALRMLSEPKISVAEAERLVSFVGGELSQ